MATIGGFDTDKKGRPKSAAEIVTSSGTRIYLLPVETFRAAGLWQRIIDRLAASGHPGLEEQAEVVFQELVLEENTEVITAIRGGDNYQSLWEREDG